MSRNLGKLLAAACWGICCVGCQETSQAAEMESAAASRSVIVNQVAPDFSLLNQNEQEVTLHSLRGRWVVLYFYPKDDTPGCACQANEFTHLLSTFRDMNAEVLGVSPDSPESHRMFIKKYDLALTLLSDPDHQVMEKYGVWVQSGLGERKYGRVIRTTMIIGPDGLVRHHWPEVIPQGHAARVRKKLSQLQQPAP